MRVGLVVSVPIEGFGDKIPATAEIKFEISAPPATPSQLINDEYPDRTLLSLGRRHGEGEGMPMKLLTLHTHDRSRTNLRSCSLLLRYDNQHDVL